MTREQAEAAVAAIIYDVTDRGGLGDEWYAIDDAVRDEIREDWVQIVLRAANGH